MTTIQNKTVISGSEEVTDTSVKKTGRFLFWKTEWWERVHTEHIANDIFIKTDKPIRHIYLNDKLIKL